MGDRRDLRSWAIIAGSTIAFVAGPALAVPPPPMPKKFEQSWDAIDALTPFLGEWHGTEFQPDKTNRSFPISVYWHLSRLGGEDVVLLEHGFEQTPLESLADQFDILTFSPNERQYKLFLAGYRLSGKSESTGQLIVVHFDGRNLLSWIAAQDDGGGRRTTLSLLAGKLVEAVEEIGRDGRLTHISDAEFSR